VLFVCLLSRLLAANSAAQQTTAPAGQAPPSQEPDKSQNNDDADKSKDNKAIQKQQKTGTSNDRLFFTLPNFLTVETKDVPPLTAWQKMKVVTRGAFDPVMIPWYGIQAGLSQALNTEAGYGQGAEGYGKRYATHFADGTIENYFSQAFLPILLRQDPRYFQMGKGGFKRRTGYAVSRIFITRSDSGHRQFNFSEIVGSGVASAISTYSYHPQADRNVPNTVTGWWTQIGWDTLTIFLKEFWPDINRKLTKKKQAAR
jgi:hypothetical protein